jgi:cold shock CspA family protein
MRIDGKLTKWNDDRGFGFITSHLGGQEIFVHVSAFPKDGQRPRIGESLSFEIESDANGRKRAKAVSRPALAKVRPVRQRESAPPRERRRLLRRAAPLLVAIVIGTAGYGEYSRRARQRGVAADIEPSGAATAPAVPSTSATFRCDGRIHCSQMTSCDEATYFLRHCPGVKMDGDNDGVPCEEQWCTSAFAK